MTAAQHHVEVSVKGWPLVSTMFSPARNRSSHDATLAVGEAGDRAGEAVGEALLYGRSAAL